MSGIFKRLRAQRLERKAAAARGQAAEFWRHKAAVLREQARHEDEMDRLAFRKAESEKFWHSLKRLVDTPA